MPSGGLMEMLFSWLNHVFSWLVSLGVSGRLNWLADNWPVLVLVIGLLCVAVDIGIWILRYRPEDGGDGLLGLLVGWVKAKFLPQQEGEAVPVAHRRARTASPDPYSAVKGRAPVRRPAAPSREAQERTPQRAPVRRPAGQAPKAPAGTAPRVDGASKVLDLPDTPRRQAPAAQPAAPVRPIRPAPAAPPVQQSQDEPPTRR